MPDACRAHYGHGQSQSGRCPNRPSVQEMKRHCNKQTMMKVGIALAVLLAVAYAALPQFRSLIRGLSPVPLTLLCPLSMLFMMKGMLGAHSAGEKDKG
jgi:hypothetical protein